MEVEINLRIPTVKDPLTDDKGVPIATGDVRFAKRFRAPKLPKPGDVVDLMVQPDIAFQATVVRTDWHEEKERFVVCCRYASPSMPRPHYLALMDDREWTCQPLWGTRVRRASKP